MRHWLSFKHGSQSKSKFASAFSDCAPYCWKWDCAGKKSLHAAEQETESGKEKRNAWREQVAGISADRLVFLDESGVTTDMTRRYGRSERGQRIREATPGGHWRTVTMLGAISSEGWQATMTIAAPTDGEVFLAYLRDVLGPTLRPGQVVVMDNLSAHKVNGVAEAIQAAGAQVLYLPPYSPDFNPIEACWSVVKQHLRKCKARSLDALDLAIPVALNAVSKKIIANCFRHCGYALQ